MLEEKENKQHCEGRLQLPLFPPAPLNSAIAINQNPALLAFGRQRDPQRHPQAAVVQLPLHWQFRHMINHVGCHAVGPVEASIVHRIARTGEQSRYLKPLHILFCQVNLQHWFVELVFVIPE
jgi:hypothetical protein